MARAARSDREWDYLETVARLSERRWPARVSEVARRLGVGAPAAVDELGRLRRKGFLEHRSGLVRLSGPGRRLWVERRRRHRVLEVLFVRAGLSRDEACRDAGKVDLRLSPRAADALYAFLDKPESCPHGSAITRPPAQRTRNRPRSASEAAG